MLKNPFVRYFEVVNDTQDFKMPYQLYGNVDLELMQTRYNNLSNKPKSYLHVRLTCG